MAGLPASPLCFLALQYILHKYMHHATFCSLDMYHVSPRNSWVSWISLPEQKWSCFPYPCPCPHCLLSKGKVFAVYAGRDLVTMYCFFFIFSHAPHGKQIKSPAKFQKPLLMARPAEVCPGISCHHGDCRTTFLQSVLDMQRCFSWPGNLDRFCVVIYFFFIVSLC